MIDQLATDPGAWNIIGWTAIIVGVGAFVFWAVTTLILGPKRETPRVRDGEPHHKD